MEPYNVEIFDRAFNFIHNYTVSRPDYKYDYLSPQENSIIISFNKNVKIGQYIRIYNDLGKYEGVISATQAINGDFMEVRFKPLTEIINHIMYVDTLTMGTYAHATPLETIICNELTNFYINGITSTFLSSQYQYPADNAQKIQGFTLTKLTTTSNWALDLERNVLDTNGNTTEYWRGNLQDILVDAMKVYKIGAYMSLDITNKKVYCSVGVKSLSTVRKIESDLPNVLKRNVVLSEVTDIPNKVLLYLRTMYNPSDKPIYYRHSDNSWSTSNTDRLTPVIEDIWSYGDVQSTMSTDAEIQTTLAAKYKTTENTNLIELTLTRGDDTYKGLQIGDIVQVIVGDTEYTSMFTGYEETDTMKLIFGMLRMDLTKIIGRTK